MSESDTISYELFAALVQRLLAPISSARWSYDPASFSLISDTELSLPLAQIYKPNLLTSENPSLLLELENQLRAFLMPPSNSPPSLSTLVPCLRSYMSFAREQAAEDPFVFFPYADVLGVGLVFNQTGQGESIDKHDRPIRYSDLDQLGLSAGEAVDLAVENLHRISLDPFRVVQSGFYTSPWKDSHDGARLLLTELFSNLAVAGEVVALTPTPDTLIVTGSKDVVGLELMMSIATTLIKQDNALRALPLVLRNGLWTSFTALSTDPIFNTIHSYRLNVLNTLYGEQESFLLKKKMDKPKVTVSSFSIENDRRSGYLFSKSTISEGSVNTFPECDIIEFIAETNAGKKRCVARVPFKKVLEMLFLSLIEDPNLRPRRWRLNNFPQRTELAVLGMVPQGQGAINPPSRTAEDIAKAQTEAIVTIEIPKGATLTFSADAKNKESVLEFVVENSIEELSAFYLDHLQVGNTIAVPTEQGQFLIAEALSAACAREAWFGPGKGETVLRLIKRVNFNTPSVHNAFIKQDEILRSFEHFFGISLLQKMQPTGNLKVMQESVLQDFLSPDLPETLVRFFRIQMTGRHTVYMTAEKQTPHTIIKMDSGLIATINAERTREGTYCSLSRSLVDRH